MFNSNCVEISLAPRAIKIRRNVVRTIISGLNFASHETMIAVNPRPPAVVDEIAWDAQPTIIKPARPQITPERIKAEIGIPCVIKPIGCGSSCGVSIVKTEEEFAPAVAWAASYKQMILVEQFLKGREVTISVVGHKALPITEIIPHEGFYDYKNKYQDGLTTHVCPAQINEADYKKCQELSVRIFDLLRMNQYGRIDMIYDENTHEFWFIEANNLPGMTNTSLLPEAAKVAGISYEDLCEKIVLSCGRDEIEGL